MRALTAGIVVLVLAGCGGDPTCADPEGEELPVCSYEIAELPQPIEFCPGDQWGAADGCNSCGCDANGDILCTSVECTE